MKNVLLLIPTETYRAQAFVDAAMKLDVSITIASQRQQAMAKSMGDRTLVVAMDNPPIALNQIKKFHQRKQIDAIVSVDDLGLSTAALASKALGLKHISTNSVQLTQNKLEMRLTLENSSVLQPEFQSITADKHSFQSIAQEKFPLVVKPIGLSGSIGVIRVNDHNELSQAVKKVSEIQVQHGCNPSTPLLVETYIEGREYAAEAIVISGKLEILTIFQKPHPLTGPYFSETIYVSPPDLEPRVLAKLEKSLDSARELLGITTGPIHAEFRVTPHEDVFLIELAARSIGGMCSKAVPLANGQNLEYLILCEALEIRIEEVTTEKQASGVYMIPAPKSGKVKDIKGVDVAKTLRWITSVDMTTTLGTELKTIPYDAKYVGFIFAKAPSTKIVISALELAFQEIELEFE